jgi:hypothetical protein
MDLRIQDEELRRIASEASFKGELSGNLAAMFRQTLQIVAAVSDESVLSRFKCLKYRTIRGPGSRRRLALTEDADLVIRIQNGKQKPKMIVERIIRSERRKK